LLQLQNPELIVTGFLESFNFSYISGSIIKHCTVFGWGNLKERPQLEDLGVEGRIIVKAVLSMMGWCELVKFYT
jgi:hypothetical protein